MESLIPIGVVVAIALPFAIYFLLLDRAIKKEKGERFERYLENKFLK